MEKANTSEEQSMEEILQSIKRIIADDEAEEAETKKEKSTKKDAFKSQTTEDDILELSDFVDSNADQDESDIAPSNNPLSDLLDNAADQEEQVNIDMEHALKDTPENISNDNSHADDILASIDGLLNAEVAQASTNALQQLKKLNQTQAELQQPQVTGAVSFRSGVTMEDLVVEMLKPELKQWLNNNLPQIVERLVQVEIKKISQN